MDCGLHGICVNFLHSPEESESPVVETEVEDPADEEEGAEEEDEEEEEEEEAEEADEVVVTKKKHDDHDEGDGGADGSTGGATSTGASASTSFASTKSVKGKLLKHHGGGKHNKHGKTQTLGGKHNKHGQKHNDGGKRSGGKHHKGGKKHTHGGRQSKCRKKLKSIFKKAAATGGEMKKKVSFSLPAEDLRATVEQTRSEATAATIEANSVNHHTEYVQFCRLMVGHLSACAKNTKESFDANRRSAFQLWLKCNKSLQAMEHTIVRKLQQTKQSKNRWATMRKRDLRKHFDGNEEKVKVVWDDAKKHGRVTPHRLFKDDEEEASALVWIEASVDDIRAEIDEQVLSEKRDVDNALADALIGEGGVMNSEFKMGGGLDCDLGNMIEAHCNVKAEKSTTRNPGRNPTPKPSKSERQLPADIKSIIKDEMDATKKVINEANDYLLSLRTSVLKDTWEVKLTPQLKMFKEAYDDFHSRLGDLYIKDEPVKKLELEFKAMKEEYASSKTWFENHRAVFKDVEKVGKAKKKKNKDGEAATEPAQS